MNQVHILVPTTAHKELTGVQGDYVFRFELNVVTADLPLVALCEDKRYVGRLCVLIHHENGDLTRLIEQVLPQY